MTPPNRTQVIRPHNAFPIADKALKPASFGTRELGESSFLSLDEAAREIGCCRRFLEKRIEDGELAVFRPSARLLRLKRSELNRWIESYSFGGRSRGGVRA